MIFFILGSQKHLSLFDLTTLLNINRQASLIKYDLINVNTFKINSQLSSSKNKIKGLTLTGIIVFDAKQYALVEYKEKYKDNQK